MQSANLQQTAVPPPDADGTAARSAATPLATVARQPIFDASLSVVAYELLYRTPGATQAHIKDPSLATAQVVIGATLDIGFTHLVGRHPAYINFPVELLLSRLQPPLHPGRVVIEVLEGALPDDALMDCLRELRALGYRIALDDYDIRVESTRLLEQADIVKVDIREHSPVELAASVRALRRYPVRLVAEKVETREELARCRALGFDLFQGYFLQKPQIVQARRAACARLPVLDLVVKMNDPAVETEELERAICRDVGLSYRILRCINSSYFGIPREVCSIRQAIVMLGHGELQKLCWLMLMAGLDGQPAYVCIQSLQRARMCEALCQAARLGQGDLYFMTGMLSAVDVLLGQPMEEAVAMLPVSRCVLDALLLRQGDLGEALGCVEHYERCDWQHVRFRNLTPEQIAHAYLQAAEWADCTWGRFQRNG